MKERLTRNMGLKVLSLFVAFLVWVVILNVDDPMTTKTFRNIPVTKINENALAQKDKVYEVVSGDTVDVKVRAKRSIIESLDNSDFQAIADLSKLSIVYAVPIEVSVPKYGDKVEILDQNYTMQVTLENLETKQFKINVVTVGTVADGYYIKDKTTSPNIIQVSGAESVINKIDQVVVEVNVNNIRESFTKTEKPKVYDKNGTVMDYGKMTLSSDEVDVSVDLLKTKTVNLYIDLKGTPYYGYKFGKFDYEPHEVVIAGEQGELDKVQYIIGEYNINYKRENISDEDKNKDVITVEDEVNIADFIKNDVILVDDNQKAVVNIQMEKLKSKDIDLNSSDIEMKNLPEGLEATIDTKEIQVEVLGDENVLAGINKYNLKPYVNLSDADVGTRLFQIHFNPPDSDVTISGANVWITVNKAP
ncbi:MAG: YbbR-like protein [Lachnoclostridium sp.]|jgi:YbbR domain-containing protein